MAKLKNTQYATFDKSKWGNKSSVVVGNNRKLHYCETDGEIHLQFYLHGSMVAQYSKLAEGYELILDTCGYMTTTTRQAMCDALGLFGLRGGVSFSKGEFKSSVGGLNSDDDDYKAAMMLLGKEPNNHKHYYLF